MSLEDQFTLHPQVYRTGEDDSLLHLLEGCWVRELQPGTGTCHIISGFGNYNGGVRFFRPFERHIELGGRVRALFSGSTSSRLTSRELVEQLLAIGCEVRIVNRKRLVHAKLYGTSVADQDSLVVTSGNFTGPGMSQNVEAALLLSPETTKSIGFIWEDLWSSIDSQSWQAHSPRLDDRDGPGWNLLYDERAAPPALQEEEQETLILTLSNADTARIQADPGTNAGKGSQYFWLSRDSFNFFPALTIRNERGRKATFSCIVELNYVDLDVTDENCRVTFEAENNLDFRLGTGKLRYTKLAEAGDMAALTRTAHNRYELRIFRRGTAEFQALDPHATSFIGHQGKRYGTLSSARFKELLEA